MNLDVYLTLRHSRTTATARSLGHLTLSSWDSDLEASSWGAGSPGLPTSLPPLHPLLQHQSPPLLWG